MGRKGVSRKWRYNKKIKKWVLIECRPGRKPPCRIIKVSDTKPQHKGGRKTGLLHQTGTSNLSRDALYFAKLPGKRVSKSGKVYYEYRKNRSDLYPEEWSRARKKKKKSKKK